MAKSSHKETLSIIDNVKKKVKQSDVYKDLCKKLGVDEDVIFLVPMAFVDDLDVSARTDKGCIYFNSALKDDFNNQDHYMMHELTHWGQQCFGDKPTTGSLNSEDYLDNEFEQEGFQAQTEYLSETRDDKAAINYVEKVLDYHDVDEGDKKERRKDLLHIAYPLVVVKRAGTFKIPQGPLNTISNWIKKVATEWAIRYTSIEDAEKLKLAEHSDVTTTDNVPLPPRRTLKMPLIDFFENGYFNVDKIDIDNAIKKHKWPPFVYINLYHGREHGPFVDDGLQGQYNHNRIFLYIKLLDIKCIEDFHDQILSVNDTLYHEIQHLMQMVLHDIIGPGVGLPSKKLMKGYYGKSYLHPKYDQLDKYTRQDVDPFEFYTDLADYIKEFNRYTANLSHEAKKDFMTEFIGDSDFFSALYTHNRPMWQKAMTEFVKGTGL